MRSTGAGGRPLVALSLELNRLLGGEAVWGYHLFNLLVHAAAGLVLFGLIRRTLLLAGSDATPPGGGAASERHPSAAGVAFAAALLWIVHPLQTESVTCVIQRTESLAGLFYLLTFYAFARAVMATARARPAWMIGCWVACVMGAATKELVATAPVLLFLYDRTFVAGGFRQAWRERWRLHAGLAVATWGLVAFLVRQSGIRGGAVGFGHGITAWDYALTQCQAIVMYLKLAVWPHPLVLDYGTPVVHAAAQVWPQMAAIAALVAGTGWAIVRRPAIGFLGAWFFAILAPSSSFVPLVTQTMAEHRMYLPLAAVIVGGTVALARLRRTGLALGLTAAIALGITTLARNETYRSAESIWTDTVTKQPGNPRAHYLLAQLAENSGHLDAAIAQGLTAVRLVPKDAVAHFSLAFSYAAADRYDEAVREYRESARLEPDLIQPHINLVAALARLGRYDEAVTEAEFVVRHEPDSAYDHFNLAEVYRRAGRPADALAHYAFAARTLSDSAPLYQGWGMACLDLRRFEEAVKLYRVAVRLAPDDFASHVNLAGALLTLGRPREAITEYERADALKPGNPVVAAYLAQARREADGR
ncbi:MAG TPA: tetratricopeptide repeat protein [Opitutaceae bacterium]|nr:tetratricopeptide repeat protein [Opitutaceae bacterium]